jgi:hypothetical protein
LDLYIYLRHRDLGDFEQGVISTPAKL